MEQRKYHLPPAEVVELYNQNPAPYPYDEKTVMQVKTPCPYSLTDRIHFNLLVHRKMWSYVVPFVAGCIGGISAFIYIKRVYQTK